MSALITGVVALILLLILGLAVGELIRVLEIRENNSNQR